MKIKAIISVILLSFALALTSYGQILTYGGKFLDDGSKKFSYDAPVYTTEYQAVLDEMTDPPGTDTAGWQNDMVYSLDSAGFWDRMDYLNIYATKDATDALIDWINPTVNATAVNSPSFAMYGGYTSDGTTSYINTGYAPITDSVNFSRVSGTAGVYMRTWTAGNIGGLIGVNQGDDDIYLTVNSNTIYVRLVAGATTSTTGIVTGTYFGTRTASNAIELYINGASAVSNTTTNTALPTTEVYVMRIDGNDAYMDEEFSIAFIMNGITDSEATTLNNIFERYMDRIGAGVQ